MASTTTTALLLLVATVLVSATIVNGQGQGPEQAQGQGKKWCIAKKLATRQEMQANLDYACGAGIDCEPIKSGGACFHPDNVWAHASYAMNSYYQSKGKDPSLCDFKGTGELVTVDPSTPRCKYLSD